mmetsp:Transcript_43312/g.86059  ORF Transcript_43312/g.86059 Transcript_43312/m.86059 type:complete len:510 (+) Transcript_43312:331-1860(+)
MPHQASLGGEGHDAIHELDGGLVEGNAMGHLAADVADDLVGLLGRAEALDGSRKAAGVEERNRRARGRLQHRIVRRLHSGMPRLAIQELLRMPGRLVHGRLQILLLHLDEKVQPRLGTRDAGRDRGAQMLGDRLRFCSLALKALHRHLSLSACHLQTLHRRQVGVLICARLVCAVLLDDRFEVVDLPSVRREGDQLVQVGVRDDFRQSPARVEAHLRIAVRAGLGCDVEGAEQAGANFHQHILLRILRRQALALVRHLRHALHRIFHRLAIVAGQVHGLGQRLGELRQVAQQLVRLDAGLGRIQESPRLVDMPLRRERQRRLSKEVRHGLHRSGRQRLDHLLRRELCDDNLREIGKALEHLLRHFAGPQMQDGLARLANGLQGARIIAAIVGDALHLLGGLLHAGSELGDHGQNLAVLLPTRIIPWRSRDRGADRAEERLRTLVARLLDQLEVVHDLRVEREVGQCEQRPTHNQDIAGQRDGGARELAQVLRLEADLQQLASLGEHIGL